VEAKKTSKKCDILVPPDLGNFYSNLVFLPFFVFELQQKSKGVKSCHRGDTKAWSIICASGCSQQKIKIEKVTFFHCYFYIIICHLMLQDNS